MTRLISRLVYYFHLSWVRVLLAIITTRDVKGMKNVPKKGPLILASNHMSNGDPPVITGSFPRPIAWLTKAEWFKTPFVGWQFRLAGMIPVRRFEADLGALRQAQRLLEDGGVLGMFPEGTRGGDRGLQRGEPGSALVALRSGAPILPAAIWGTEHVKLPGHLFRRTHTHLRFGKPFKLERSGSKITRQDVELGTERIMREIAALLPEQWRGLYRDETPAEPLKAG
ncbi:MAG TPA: lysophospholipid acyltransferase family protein [Dehalococcoidia bacterium]|nr:lysophospholipid acyltransferase family protein [Dehalococcoidia bacterium]